ncbi:hypothetical protein V1478_012446 [Vespula squamosa]|uniref:Uncharacterized protein n=1 Tax=Vespula squamosa TaxID=30214 RepID=A0ABD2AFG1_VESSQ
MRSTRIRFHSQHDKSLLDITQLLFEWVYYTGVEEGVRPTVITGPSIRKEGSTSRSGRLRGTMLAQHRSVERRIGHVVSLVSSMIRIFLEREEKEEVVEEDGGRERGGWKAERRVAVLRRSSPTAPPEWGAFARGSIVNCSRRVAYTKGVGPPPFLPFYESSCAVSSLEEDYPYGGEKCERRVSRHLGDYDSFSKGKLCLPVCEYFRARVLYSFVIFFVTNNKCSDTNVYTLVRTSVSPFGIYSPQNFPIGSIMTEINAKEKGNNI